MKSKTWIYNVLAEAVAILLKRADVRCFNKLCYT